MVADEHQSESTPESALEQQLRDRRLDAPPAGMRDRLLGAMQQARDAGAEGASPAPEPVSLWRIWRGPAGIAAAVLIGLQLALVAGLARVTDAPETPGITTDNARLRQLSESRDADVARIVRLLRPGHRSPDLPEPDESDPNS